MMAAGVVDGLETIQVEVAQHVRAVAAVRRVHRLLQPTLELAPIDQPGQRIVRRLIGHLPRQAAHLGDIVQQHHRADGLTGLHAASARPTARPGARCRTGVRISSATAPEVRAACRRPAPGAPARPSSLRSASSTTSRQLLERHAVRPQRLPMPSRRAAAGLRYSTRPSCIGRDQRLGQRLERAAASASGAPALCSACTRLRRQHLDADDQQRPLALVLDRPGRQLEARTAGPVQPDQIDLVALGRGLARQPAAHIVGHQLGVLGRHQVLQPSTDQLLDAAAHQAGELRLA